MTVQAQPETIFNEIVERIERLVAARHPNEFEIRRVRREVEEKLAKVDPSGALELRAILALVEGDVDTSHALFERALSMSADKCTTVMRYVEFLDDMALCSEAGNVIQKHWNFLRNVPGALKTCRRVLMAGGWMGRSRQIDEDLERLNAADKPSIAIEHEGLTEEQVMQPVEFVRKFLRNNGESPVPFTVSVVPLDEGQEACLYEMHVRRDSEATAELEWELQEALADRGFAAVESAKLVFALLPRSE